MTATVVAWLAFVGPVSALAATFGASGQPYLNGIVCRSGATSTALVSWPSAATNLPAYAMSAVTDPADPPATVASAVAAQAPLSPGGGLTAADVAALGFLLRNHGSAAGRAEVAQVADAVSARGIADPQVAGCLARVGASPSADLWAQANRLAGPYRLRVTTSPGRLVLGRPTLITAVVVSASGDPVPGVDVVFTAAPPARPALMRVTTGADGVAATRIVLPIGSAVSSVTAGVTARVPGTPILMSAPGQISLVAAGADVALTRSVPLAVDLTADPQAVLQVDHQVVVPHDQLDPTVSVSGLRGHLGTMSTSVIGPLPISASTGCADAGTVDAQRPPPRDQVVRLPDVPVRGDGRYAAGPITFATAGCFVLASTIATVDAQPAVTRRSRTVVVGVVPIHLRMATPAAALRGPLRTNLTVTGFRAARITRASATAYGPSASNDGSCVPTTAGHGPQLAMTGRVAGAGVQLSSATVSDLGCYAIAVDVTVDLPRLGTVELSSGNPDEAPTGATLVLDPAVSVTGLSSAGVRAGRPVTASVTVSGTFTLPGSLRLRLLRLPYDWRGCFGRNWSAAAAVAVSPATGAAGTLTSGDGTYQVVSGPVPSAGCWTVLPVLHLADNPAIRVVEPLPIDSMTAFTGLAAVPAQAASAARSQGGTGAVRLAATAIGTVVLLAAAVTAMVLLAKRNDQDDPLTAGDQPAAWP